MKMPQFLIARRKQIATAGLVAGAILIIGLLLPQDLIIPVKGAAPRDWNPNSWWSEPWGVSGVHKGIDIFALEQTPVVAPTYGLVIYEGQIDLGGNVVCVLGPKWRVHFFGHLRRSKVGFGEIVTTGEEIGEVGSTGNARGKAPHLHYQ